MSLKGIYALTTTALISLAAQTGAQDAPVDIQNLPPCCRAKFEQAATQQNNAGNHDIQLPNGKSFSLIGLTNQAGEKLTPEYFETELKDKVILIYFGFPDCKVFCSPAMRVIHDGLKNFDPQTFQMIVITTDLNATAKDMQEWLKRSGLDEYQAIGLTGNQAALRDLYKTLHVLDPNGNHITKLAAVKYGEFLGSTDTIALSPQQPRSYSPQTQAIERFLREEINLPPKPPQAQSAPALIR